MYVSCVSNTNNRGREADDATHNKSYIQNQSSSHFRNQIWLDSAIVCSTQSVKGPCCPIVPSLQNDCCIGRAWVASSALFAQTHTCTNHHNCAQHTILPCPAVSAYNEILTKWNIAFERLMIACDWRLATGNWQQQQTYAGWEQNSYSTIRGEEGWHWHCRLGGYRGVTSNQRNNSPVP